MAQRPAIPMEVHTQVRNLPGEKELRMSRLGAGAFGAGFGAALRQSSLPVPSAAQTPGVSDDAILIASGSRT
jgi:hypothetical protein